MIDAESSHDACGGIGRCAQKRALIIRAARPHFCSLAPLFTVFFSSGVVFAHLARRRMPTLGRDENGTLHRAANRDGARRRATARGKARESKAMRAAQTRLNARRRR
jgi:hypothetical protein